VTTDTGQFNFSVPPLEIGYPYTFHVEGWVIVDPCVLARGRVYLPNPKAEKVSIRVLPRGDRRIKSPGSLACIVVEETSQFKPRIATPKGPQSLLQRTSSAVLARVSTPDLFPLEINRGHFFEAAYRPEPLWNQSKSAVVGPAPAQPRVNTFLEKQAQELGLTPEQLSLAIDQWSKSPPDLYQKGLAALHQDRYVEARQYISDSIKLPGGDILEHYVLLGRAEYDTGHYAAAEAALRKVLAVHEDDPLVLTNLGLVLSAEARFAEAEELQKRALAINERTLGPNHPKVARVLSNIADLYIAYGRYTESERLFTRAIAIDETALGHDDPQNVRLRGLVGLLHLLQGQPDAEPILREALATDEKALGPDDPDVSEMVVYLALAYSWEEKYTDAEPLLKRALVTRERVSGPDNPDLAQLLGLLAIIYLSQNKPVEAQPLLERARDLQEKGLDPNHPDLLPTLAGLSWLYLLQHKQTEAESVLKRAVAVQEKAYGPDAPNEAGFLTSLSALYRMEERCAEAVPLLKRALSILEKATVRPYLKVAALAAENMAACLHNLGYDAEAKPYEQQAAEISARLNEKPQGPAPKKP